MYPLPPLPHLRLRATVCTQEPRQPCRTCSLRPTCVYTRLFESFIEGKPPPFLKGLDTSPRPYVFESIGEASEARDFGAGDELVFDLLLFGQAVEFQGFVLVALERMAAGGLGKHRARLRLAGLGT